MTPVRMEQPVIIPWEDINVYVQMVSPVATVKMVNIVYVPKLDNIIPDIFNNKNERKCCLYEYYFICFVICPSEISLWTLIRIVSSR